MAVQEDGTLSEVVVGRSLEGEPHNAQAVTGGGEEGDGWMKTTFTLPRYDPFSSTSSGSRDEAQLKVPLSRLQMEAQEKAQNRSALLQFQLRIKRLEIEADKAVRLTTGTSSTSTTLPHSSFDISKHIALLPTFRETEVNSYFSALKRIAAALQWLPEVWALLLQCKIHGKALGGQP